MYSSRAIAVVLVSVLFPIFASVAVGLRLYSRKGKALGFKADDYLIIIALIVTIAGSVVYIIGALGGGVGAHFDTLTSNQIIENGKILFALQFFYIGSVAFVKVSVLLFYQRIFVTRRFILTTYAMIMLTIMWFTAFIFASLFQAWPISYNWTGIGTSTDYIVIYYTCDAVDIIIDILTLCLPIPVIRRLQISTRKKWTLIGIFMLGSFACVSSMIRLYYLIQFTNPANLDDYTYNTSNLLIWSAIEPNTSIIAACLPTFAPLIKDHSLQSVIGNIRSYFSSASSFSLKGSGEKRKTSSEGSDLFGAPSTNGGFSKTTGDAVLDSRAYFGKCEGGAELGSSGSMEGILVESGIRREETMIAIKAI